MFVRPGSVFAGSLLGIAFRTRIPCDADDRRIRDEEHDERDRERRAIAVDERAGASPEAAVLDLLDLLGALFRGFAALGFRIALLLLIGTLRLAAAVLIGRRRLLRLLLLLLVHRGHRTQTRG